MEFPAVYLQPVKINAILLLLLVIILGNEKVVSHLSQNRIEHIQMRIQIDIAWSL